MFTLFCRANWGESGAESKKPKWSRVDETGRSNVLSVMVLGLEKPWCKSTERRWLLGDRYVPPVSVSPGNWRTAQLAGLPNCPTRRFLLREVACRRGGEVEAGMIGGGQVVEWQVEVSWFKMKAVGQAMVWCCFCRRSRSPLPITSFWQGRQRRAVQVQWRMADGSNKTCL